MKGREKKRVQMFKFIISKLKNPRDYMESLRDLGLRQDINFNFLPPRKQLRYAAENDVCWEYLICN